MNSTSIQRPRLPQDLSASEQEQREFQLSLCRASYNYMFSYLEPLAMSADLPAGEAFTLEYKAKVLQAFAPLAENFKRTIIALLEEELEQDVPGEAIPAIEAVEAALERLKADSEQGFHPLRDAADLKELLQAVSALPQSLDQALTDAARLPKNLEKIVDGMACVFEEFEKEGPTAFLKNAFFDVLDCGRGRDYLEVDTVEGYDQLYNVLPVPLTLTVDTKSWMNLAQGEKPWEQDWFFGYQQIAGYNTTNLRAVVGSKAATDRTVLLDELLRKFPITDQIFQEVVGSGATSLLDAARQGRLYVCDYDMLVDLLCGQLHGRQRYAAPSIALFLWNQESPMGYPPGGALQPVAIQLGQIPDAEKTPIFTPNDGLKWQVAKLWVQNACAVQHESVAHLGACHLTIEPMIVATNRQLSADHPLMTLLKPHFRFTIDINDSAIHSLIVPGGVVASVLSTTIQSSMNMVVKANDAWRFDEQYPDRLFRDRGVTADSLPDFPFRDDTLMLWNAIRTFVRSYLHLYYAGSTASERNEMVRNDYELQNWIDELVDPEYAGVKGLGGLIRSGDSWRIESFDYLVDVVSLIIYTASAQHASVNYAQYPLMSYVPSVPGALYATPPAASHAITKPDYLKWLPPLDVALYQLSFSYLLSGVQYDRLGFYSDDPRVPYFTDSRVDSLVAAFQSELAVAELTIRKRNEQRPFPYLFQLPSMVPNSISI